MSSEKVLGLHHMTAICGPAQENVDFFVGVLGLRFLKLTVNFDDSSAYHLYYGDGLASPGTLITFFPYPTGRRGAVGNGQVGVTSLSIPQNAIGFWTERLRAHSVPLQSPITRGDEEVIAFTTPDGLPMELVASADHKPGKAWKEMPIAEEHAISGMRSVRLLEANASGTIALLTTAMGYEKVSEQGVGNECWTRLRAPDGSFVEVAERSHADWGMGGHGTVHHIAYRAKDDDAQARLREQVLKVGAHATPFIDRTYFHSIYFREPGHVLFEIATDGPGFDVDEPMESLGTTLKLPPHYEPYRKEIEASLPKLRIPGR